MAEQPITKVPKTVTESRVVRWLRDREPMVIVGILLVVLGSWGFIELADEVVEGSTGEVDRRIVAALRDPADPSQPIGPEWLASAGRDLTSLGGVAVLLFVIVTAAGFLAVSGAYHAMLALVLSTTSGIVVSLLMKRFFARPRPELVPHLDQVYTSSFPSGHSMMSALVYLTLAALLAPVLKHFWLRCYVLAVATILAGIVGVSRVYMGVHFPTDVLAGWAAGLVWAICCWLIGRWYIQRSRRSGRGDPELVLTSDEASDG